MVSDGVVAVAAVLALAPALAPVRAQNRPPAPAEFLVTQDTRAAWVARCQRAGDRCLNEIPTVTGSQGQRY